MPSTTRHHRTSGALLLADAERSFNLHRLREEAERLRRRAEQLCLEVNGLCDAEFADVLPVVIDLVPVTRAYAEVLSAHRRVQQALGQEASA